MGKRIKKEMKFVCEECGKEFKGNSEQSNENWEICTKDDKCECGGKFELAYFENGKRLI